MDMDEDYHHVKYTDGEELFIVHHVNDDLRVYFEEQDYVQEKRDKMFKGEIDQDEFNDFVGQMNDLEEQFNYDEVVAYQEYGKEIEWL